MTIERGGHPGEQNIEDSKLPKLPSGPGPGSYITCPRSEAGIRYVKARYGSISDVDYAAPDEVIFHMCDSRCEDIARGIERVLLWSKEDAE